MRKGLAAAALLGILLGSGAIAAIPASASDSGSGVQRPNPDEDGDKVYCSVTINDATFDVGSSTWTVPSGGHVLRAVCHYDPALSGLPVTGVSLSGHQYRSPAGSGSYTTWASGLTLGSPTYPEAGRVQLSLGAQWSGSNTTQVAATTMPCELFRTTGATIPPTECAVLPDPDAPTTGWPDPPGDYFSGGVPGVAPLDQVAEYPDYICARYLEQLDGTGSDHWRVTAVASERAPRENVTTEGPALVAGTMVQDRYQWYVEFEDPGSNDVGLGGPGRTNVEALGPKLFDLDVSDDGASVDVANGYGLYLRVERTTETGSAFKRPIPLDAQGQEAFVVDRVDDHEEAVGYCRLHVKLDEPGLGSSGTTFGGVHPPNPVDWGDGGGASDLADCIPSGLGILNPASLVKGVGCVLHWAFVPGSDQVQGVLQDFEDTYDARFPFSMVGQMYGMVDTTVEEAQAGLGSNTCPHIDLRTLHPSLASYSALDVRAPTPTGSGCAGAGGVAGDVGGWRSWMRTGMRFALWFMVMVGLSRRLGPKDDGPVLVNP